MSACFYNTSGMMVGVDLHTYMAVGVPPLDLPVPKHPHGVVVPFVWLLTSKEASTVTSDGSKMAKKGFTVRLVPHVPIPLLPPGTTEGPLLALTIAVSSTKAILGQATVTHGGKPLACCVGGFIGFNENCGGLGVVYNSNSVTTSPSAGDIAGAAFGLALSSVIGEYIGLFLPKDPFLKLIAKFLFDQTVKKWVLSKPMEAIAETVQEVVDALL